jgi:hypothetical protein
MEMKILFIVCGATVGALVGTFTLLLVLGSIFPTMRYEDSLICLFVAALAGLGVGSLFGSLLFTKRHQRITNK